MNRIRVSLILAYFAALGTPLHGADSVGTTLLEPTSARVAGLAGALSAAGADLDAIGINPAGLAGLAGTHVSFQYHRGLADDAFGAVQIGRATRRGTVGLSVGALDGGDVVLFDGVAERTVTAQKDWSAALSAARTVGSGSIGLSVKYLSSELAEAASASAFAADAGLRMDAGRLSIGAAVQNVGGDMTYEERAHPLPSLARAGGALRIGRDGRGGALYADARYRFEESDVVPAAGIEVNVAPLSLRAGYLFGDRVDSFTAGAGIRFGSLRLDYAFGMADDFDDRHLVSLSAAFGAAGAAPRPEVAAPAPVTQASADWVPVQPVVYAPTVRQPAPRANTLATASPKSKR